MITVKVFKRRQAGDPKVSQKIVIAIQITEI